MSSGVSTAKTIPMEVVLALGANLPSEFGDARETIELALSLLEMENFTQITVSDWFKSAAFPAGSGPDFVNGVLVAQHTDSAEEILARLHKIEAALGRVRNQRWGARAVDIDLIAIEGQVIPDTATVQNWIDIDTSVQIPPAPEMLLLPHPRMHERGFVLAPMAQLRPNWRHPILQISVAEMLEKLPDSALEGLESFAKPKFGALPASLRSEYINS